MFSSCYEIARGCECDAPAFPHYGTLKAGYALLWLPSLRVVLRLPVI
jgi:hypothetical protein